MSRDTNQERESVILRGQIASRKKNSVIEEKTSMKGCTFGTGSYQSVECEGGWILRIVTDCRTPLPSCQHFCRPLETRPKVHQDSDIGTRKERCNIDENINVKKG